ncbi:hypothetical protein JHFBIEKO_2302 [Methylobacterium mesophilicum]|uniref:hypothetical protein n=1 Tax=Methylobacterium mesophilicum TaxID=39956 RepID=UPI001EE1919A|nr:hypothetical protein [Methylobacterium mesophilicum]GJE21853.1 hypothetical protein JHFBIEKO_2302 [Methylobacterium mesophilicum]
MLAQSQVRGETKRHRCYRVYWLRRDGRIDGAEIIRYEDDDEAMTIARGMTDGRIELTPHEATRWSNDLRVSVNHFRIPGGRGLNPASNY